jgi:hypothetical protein
MLVTTTFCVTHQHYLCHFSVLVVLELSRMLYLLMKLISAHLKLGGYSKMGASAIVGGVLGGVQLVSGMSSANAQANAQRKSLQAQAQSTVDSSRIRQMEILQARDQANYQASVNELARQQNFQSQTFLIERQGLVEKLDAMNANSQAKQQQLQTLTAVEQKDNQTQGAMAGAEVDYQKVLQQVAQQLGAVNQQAAAGANSAQQAAGELQGRLSSRDVLAMASGIGVGSQTSQQLNDGDLMNTITQVTQALQGTQVGMELQQRIADLTSAGSETERNIKLTELGTYLNDSQFQRNIANLQYSAVGQNIDNTSQLNAAARDNASQQLNAADSMNRNTDSVNRQLAEMGYGVQSAANSSQQNNAMAGINAQYGSIGSNTFGNLLTSGINAYSTYNNVMSQQRQVEAQKQSAYLNQGLLSGNR